MKIKGDFNIFPIEIIERIFTFLTIDDIKNASLVSQRWLTASNLPIVAGTNLVLDFQLLENIQVSCLRKYKRIHFKNISSDHAVLFQQDMFENLLEKVYQLKFYMCSSLNEELLLKILYSIPNLKKLTIYSNCNTKLMLTDNILVYVFDKLKKMNIDNIDSITENAFEKLVAKKPAIETLDLKKMDSTFYEDKTKLTKLFELLAPSLKSITTLSEGLLFYLITTKGLRLEKLKLNIMFGVRSEIFHEFAPHMDCLIDLTCKSFNESIENENFMDICKYMINLKILKINNCHNVTNNQLVELKRLKKLEKLYLDGFCYENADDGIIKGIASQRNESMLEFMIDGQFSDGSLIAIARNFPNLRFLDVHSYEGFNGKCLREIFQHLRWLRVLNLGSFKLNKCKHEENLYCCDEQYSISCLKGLRRLSFGRFSFYPGVSLDEISKLVELEFLKLADIQEMPEQGIRKICKNCRSLKTFELDRCEPISNSMIYLILKSLKRLKTLTIRQKIKLQPNFIKKIKQVFNNVEICIYTENDND